MKPFPILPLLLLLLGIPLANAQIVGFDPPTASPNPSTPFVTSMNCTLSTSTLKSQIYYDLNNTEPFDVQSNHTIAYEAPFPITETTVVRAVAVSVGGVTSEIATFKYVKDQPPTVTLSTPVTGQILRRGTAYSMTSSPTDPDGNSIKVTYQYLTGTPATWTDIGSSNNEPTYSVSWTPTVVAGQKVRAVAADAYGAIGYSAEVDVTVTAENIGPMVEISSPAEGAGFIFGQPITITAKASDQDPLGGGITRVDFYQGSTFLSSDTSSPYQAAWNNAPLGVQTLQAKAFDNHTPPTMGTSATISITVRPNKKPSVVLATPTGPFTAPASFTLSATASDTDGSVTSVTFYRNGTYLGRDTSGSSYTQAVADLAAGTYSFTARAFDNAIPADSGISAAVSVTVAAADQAPTANAGRDTSITMPSQVKLDGTGSSDPEGPIAAYQWLLPPGASLTNTAIASPTATFTGPGTFTFTLIVTDGGSPARKDTDQVVVRVYAKPAVTSKLLDSATVGTPYSYTITASGDNQPTIIIGTKPTWLNVVPPPGGTGSTKLTGTPTLGGWATVEITASNNVGNKTDTLRIFSRQAPTISLDLLASVIAQEKTKVTFVVAATGSPVVNYQWQLITTTGPVSVGSNSTSYVLESASLSASGNYRVIAFNGVAPADTSRTCRLDVKQAIAITANPVTPPTPVTVGRKATFQVKAVGAPTLLYQWFRGSAPLGPPAAKDSTLVLDPVKLADAGLYRARVTNDYSDTSKAATFKWSDTARLIVDQPKVDKPKSSPAAPADFEEALTISLSTDTLGASIRYTLDGTAPTQANGTLYDPAVKIVLAKATTTLKAKAFKDPYLPSDVFTGVFTYVPPKTVAKPTARPATANFKTTLSCTLSTSTPGAAIKYTLNGTDPRTGAATDYAGPFPLAATTTVTAYAIAPSMTASDTLIKVYVLDKPQSKVLAPEAAPPGASFTGTIKVTLTSRSDSASIHYTLDGSSPDTSNTKKLYVEGSPIPLAQSTTIRAIATRSGFLPSDIITQAYTLIPGPIEAFPTPIGSYTFDDSVIVTLKVTPTAATVYYTLNDSLPLDPKLRPIAEASVYPAAGIKLKSSYTVTAMAIMDKDTVASNPFRFSYTRKGGPLNTPLVVTANNAYSFRDSLKVSLASTNGSTIHYTTDGSNPTSSSTEFAGSIWIDTTTTLQALALHKDFLPSKILVAAFTLVADTPSANPRGGSYASAQSVTLKAPSRKTPIKYTLNGTIPGPDNGTIYLPGDIITIAKSTKLKAVAFSGGIPGSMREETYEIFGTRDTVLAPGETFYLDGGFTLSNPSDQGAMVRVVLGGAEALTFSGFENVQYSLGITLVTSSSDPSQEFPNLILARSSTEGRSLYKMESAGRIYFISSAGSMPVSDPGTYFLGVDVSPPVVTYLDESIDAADTTTVRFKVEDNVYNLTYNMKRSDNPSFNQGREPVFAGTTLAFRLKNAAGTLKPLYIQLSVDDYRNVTFCPADGQSSLALSQRLKAVQGPPIWRIGKDIQNPHDLVGIPLNMDPPLTLADLGGSKTGNVEGFIYDNTSGTYTRLGQKDVLVPGQAYWLASRAAITSFQRGLSRMAPTGTGRFTVKLKHGWNQVANPHLENLYWPWARDLGDHYRASAIKGLWGYAPENPLKYVEQDVLEPWRGYYVYNHVLDTVVELSSKPMIRPIQKKKGSAQLEASLSLAFGDAPSVQLGASPLSADGVGFEDEGVLPSLSARNRFKALRQGRNLSSDWVRFDYGRILQWKVLPGMEKDAKAVAAVRVVSEDLPEGYEAWAISPMRGMKFRLGPGGSIPVSGLADDTLSILAGPARKLAEMDLMKAMSLVAPALDVRILEQAGGPEFRLDLPGQAEVRATLWTLQGTSFGEFRRNLSGGRYRFQFGSDFRRGAARPAPGVHFLRLVVRGPGISTVLTRKVIFRD